MIDINAPISRVTFDGNDIPLKTGAANNVILKCYSNRFTDAGSNLITDLDDNELDTHQLRELVGNGYNFSVIPIGMIDGEETPLLIMDPIAVANIGEGNGIMIMLQSCFHKIDEDSDFLTSYELIIEITDLASFYVANLNTNTIQSSEAVINHIDQIKDKISKLQLFKFPNATIVGEPIINNGQISGFSVNNYLQFPSIVDFRGRPFEIYFEFTTGTNIIDQQNILDSNFGLALAIKDGHGLIALSNNGMSWDIGSGVGSYDLQQNTTYMAKLTWDREQYTLSISNNGGETYTPDITIVSNLQPFPRTMFIGGASASVVGHTPTYFFGTINLNKARLVIDGLEVWQGMDDAGLATRATVSLDNLDDAGRKVIQDMIDNTVNNINIILGETSDIELPLNILGDLEDL